MVEHVLQFANSSPKTYLNPNFLLGWVHLSICRIIMHTQTYHTHHSLQLHRETEGSGSVLCSKLGL